ncbi:MAG: tripartite tricarboxylate transporter permease [Salipiger thiooxidans]|uniref:tripartite tricarboxylate transporter permease n=1 Tax=Salipiger thiooxidans TaxID=282683 RepID=UPI0021F65F68|nr:tripartite tricarboxylate transporter permease [Salipiger thiooxidans]
MLIALTLPLTFHMDPVSAMTLLIGEYVGGISGGLVTAILLRMPGTPSSIVTTFDGYPMAQQGKAERALTLGIFASVVGGLISWAFLAGMSPSLARFALGFGPWEYCSLVLAALFMLAALTQGSLVRGLLGAAAGMALSLPGIDPSIGTPRLTFGSDALLSGFGLLPVLIGAFAISQVLRDAAPFDVLEMRRMAEGEAAFMAAQRISEDQLKALEETLAEMEARLDDVTRYDIADARFHAIIGEASGNQLLQALMRQLWDYRYGEMWSLWYNQTRSITNRRNTVLDHRRILAALQRGMPDIARTAMQAHMDQVNERFFALVME